MPVGIQCASGAFGAQLPACPGSPGRGPEADGSHRILSAGWHAFSPGLAVHLAAQIYWASDPAAGHWHGQFGARPKGQECISAGLGSPGVLRWTYPEVNRQPMGGSSPRQGPPLRRRF